MTHTFQPQGPTPEPSQYLILSHLLTAIQTAPLTSSKWCNYCCWLSADPVERVSVTRPPAGGCDAPVLTLSLPHAIPVPQTTAYLQLIQLLIEYTRIDQESNHDSSTPGIVTKVYNASGLAKFSTLKMPLDNLPYMLLSWEAYVVRVRLKVLGEFSRQWSSYSTPFCVHCMECKSKRCV